MERFFFYFISVFKGVNSCVVLKIGFILIFIVYITNLMMMKVVGCVCVRVVVPPYTSRMKLHIVV